MSHPPKVRLAAAADGEPAPEMDALARFKVPVDSEHKCAPRRAAPRRPPPPPPPRGAPPPPRPTPPRLASPCL
jgi:hypothetical protein